MRLVLLRKGSFLLLVLWWCMAAPVRSSSDSTTILKSSSGYASRWCGDVNTDSNLTLTCPAHTWFHVQQKIASNDSVNNCSSLVYPQINRAIPSSSSAPALVTDCRGPTRSTDNDPQTCQERIQVHNYLEHSQIKFVEIAYECINESVQYNLCQPLSLSGITADFYLASPSFFPPTTDEMRMPHDATCHCTLTSDPGKFSVHALYLSQANGWNMTCPTCKSHFQKEYGGYHAVNVVLFTAHLQNDSPHVLDVEFQPCCQGGSADNELWIHITGSTNFDLYCNTAVGELTSSVSSTLSPSSLLSTPSKSSPSPPSSTSSTSPPSPTSSTPSTSSTSSTAAPEDTDVYVIVGAVGFSVVFIAIIIIVVVVVTVRRRRRQQSETVPRSRDSSSTAEHRTESREGLKTHDYAGLDLSANNVDDRMPPHLAEGRRFPRDGQGEVVGRIDTEKPSQGSSPPEAIYMNLIPGPEGRTREQPADSEKHYYSEIREIDESVPGT